MAPARCGSNAGQRCVASAVHGEVSDPTGAVLAGALVTVRRIDSGRVWSVLTDASGHYTLAGLDPGRYALDVRQAGFTELVRTVMLGAGETAEEPLRLNLASVVEQVNVISGPASDGMSARQMREGSARDLGEAATAIAGVQRARKAAIANDIAIRGLFHNNIATTIDGTRLYGACTFQMDPAEYHVDLAEVDHVDVVKGPFDVTTQGELGGFVKIVTRTPDAQGFLLHSNVSTGSYGYYNPSVTAELGGKDTDWLAGYSYRTSQFYKDGDGSLVSELGGYRDGYADLQAFRTQSAWSKLAFHPAANQHGEISYTRQQSGDLLYPYLTMDGVYDDADRFAARYDYFRSQGWLRGLHGLAYADKANHLMDDHLRESAGTMPFSMSEHVVSFTDGARMDADLAQGFTAGYEFYHRYWNSNGVMRMSSMGMTMPTDEVELPGVTEDVNGAYVAYRHAFGTRWLLTSGARFDHDFTNASAADAASFETYYGAVALTAHDAGASGNAMVSWQATPDVAVFTGVGSNIRFPDPQERFYASSFSMSMSMEDAWVGNPLLRHPRDTEFDLGVRTKTRRFAFTPQVFFSKLDNDVTLHVAMPQQMDMSTMSSMNAETYGNVQAYLWGAEANGSAPLGTNLMLNGSYTVTRGTKVPQPDNHIESSNLFQVPPVRATLNLTYERKGWYAEAGAEVTGRQDHVDTDENEQTTAGFSVFHLKGGYHGRSFDAEAGVNNLLSREYSEFLSYARDPLTNGVRLPEPGRNFFVNVAYRFHRGE
ncbi:TonB-dependent receptor [Silvibacterium dinghuense]|uniref:TonB-dependent receptor n=1 Tax=Silvibacterium dinghuense TaxID=1560006 RepID=UPI0013E97B05|nr:TonB-dependent receptor [Silvibacterium dinghuense]